MNDMYWIRRALAAVGPMTTLFLAGAVGLRADEDCQKRINKADHNLHEAIEHHGRDSEQAQHWRGELQQARNRCWDHGHRWWDADANRWRTDHDWDDHDHEYDHDHH